MTGAPAERFSQWCRLRSPLEAALAYAELGWAVLPLAGMDDSNCSCRRACASPAKHPLTRHGVHEASVEEPQIRRWWLQWPDANVGIATGARSRLVVVDVDLERGGRTSLPVLRAAGHDLRTTLRTLTGGGGFHLYYRQPAGLIVPNTAGRLPNVGALLPGIDLRGDGGYVVAPPSVHVSARAYRWSEPSRHLVLLPEWLWPRPPPPSPVSALPRARSVADSPYGTAALAAEVEGVRRLVVGQRNDGLNRAAFALGTLVAGGELAEDVVFQELLAAGVGVGLGEREAQATIRSGLRAGAEVPRRAPGPAAHEFASRATGHVRRR